MMFTIPSCVRRIAARLGLSLGLVLAVLAFNATPASTAPGAACGGGNGCGRGEFCQYAPGQCSGGQGVCTTTPQNCTRDYRPVCGCNNKTYGNDCTRMSARVSKLHDGACRN